jgi:hypothetical protein
LRLVAAKRYERAQLLQRQNHDQELPHGMAA